MGPQQNPILSQLSHLHLYILLLKFTLTVLPIIPKSPKWYICFKDLSEFCMHFSSPSGMLDVPPVSKYNQNMIRADVKDQSLHFGDLRFSLW